MKSLLVLLCLASTAFALTPKERDLVNGLSRINTELRANNASQEAQIAKDATDALFASQKIDSLSARLAESKKLEGDQEFELGVQQKLIKEKSEELDAAYKGWNAAKKIADEKTIEAHRNAAERDVFVWAFAVLAATAACYALFPVINKVLNVTFPWTLAWLGAWGAFVGIFYGIERFALRFLINHL